MPSNIVGWMKHEGRIVKEGCLFYLFISAEDVPCIQLCSVAGKFFTDWKINQNCQQLVPFIFKCIAMGWDFIADRVPNNLNLEPSFIDILDKPIFSLTADFNFLLVFKKNDLSGPIIIMGKRPPPLVSMWEIVF